PGAYAGMIGSADDMLRTGGQQPFPRVCDQGYGTAVLDGAIVNGQIFPMQVRQRISGRTAFGIADRTARDDDVAAIIGNLAVMSVPREDRGNPAHLHDGSPIFDTRPVELLPDLERVMVLKDDHALIESKALI